MDTLQEFKCQNDETLVFNIKNGYNVNESFAVIQDRHSGAFLKTANYWVDRHLPTEFVLDREYIFDSKDYVLYKAVMSFDPSRNTKLVTHITNNSMWFCSNAVKDGNKYKAAWIEAEEIPKSKFKILDADPEKDRAIQIFEKIIEVVLQKVGRKAEAIFRIRHGSGGKPVRWKDVITRLKSEYNIKLSNQACLNYQRKAMAAIKEELQNNPEFLEIAPWQTK